MHGAGGLPRTACRAAVLCARACWWPCHLRGSHGTGGAPHLPAPARLCCVPGRSCTTGGALSAAVPRRGGGLPCRAEQHAVHAAGRCGRPAFPLRLVSPPGCRPGWPPRRCQALGRGLQLTPACMPCRAGPSADRCKHPCKHGPGMLALRAAGALTCTVMIIILLSAHRGWPSRGGPCAAGSCQVGSTCRKACTRRWQPMCSWATSGGSTSGTTTPSLSSRPAPRLVCGLLACCTPWPGGRPRPSAQPAQL